MAGSRSGAAPRERGAWRRSSERRVSRPRGIRAAGDRVSAHVGVRLIFTSPSLQTSTCIRSPEHGSFPSPCYTNS